MSLAISRHLREASAVRASDTRSGNAAFHAWLRQNSANAVTLLRLLLAGATVFGLLAAWFAPQPAENERREAILNLSIWTLTLCLVLDGLDGYLARRLNAISRLGAGLDAAADFVGFAVAPPLIFWLVLRESVQRGAPASPIAAALLQLAVGCYVAAAAARLLHFREATRHADRAPRTFRGLPTPAAAMALLALIDCGRDLPHGAALACGIGAAAGLSVLMLSRTRFVHLADLLAETAAVRRTSPLLGFVAAVVVLAASSPAATLALGSILYVICGRCPAARDVHAAPSRSEAMP